MKIQIVKLKKIIRKRLKNYKKLINKQLIIKQTKCKRLNIKKKLIKFKNN